MQLPKKTTDWHHILRLFTPKVQGDLLGILRPLTGVIQPLLSEPNLGLIEPDGIDGIANKGKYHDLLLSEWALLDELPDEFERRFAMSEHIFLNKKKTEENQQKLSLVLFDVGPNQFGSPKLGQLVVLLLMWRRAAQAGASFRFGALQSNAWLNEYQLDEDCVLKLINNRQSNILDDSNFSFWNSEIEKLEANRIELWTVSSSELNELHSVSGNITIQEIPFSKFPSLEFTVETKIRNSKKQIVKLPDVKDQVRILRNPFEEASSSNIIERSDQRYGFSVNGRKFLRLNKNGVLLLDVMPTKSNRQSKNTQSINIGEQVVALSTAKNDVIRLLKTESGYRMIGIPKQGSIDFATNQSLSIDRRKMFDSFLYIPNYYEGRSVLFKDSKNNLRRLDLSCDGLQLNSIAKDVYKLGRVNSIYYFVQLKAKKLIISMFLENPRKIVKTYPLGSYRHPKVIIHESGVWNSNSVGCIAYQLSESLWNIVFANKLQEVRVEAQEEVFGVYMADKFDKAPTLVVISSDRKSIFLIYGDLRTVLFETNDVIVDVRMNPIFQCFAFTTNGSLWRFFSIKEKLYILDIG